MSENESDPGKWYAEIRIELYARLLFKHDSFKDQCVKFQAIITNLSLVTTTSTLFSNMLVN